MQYNRLPMDEFDLRQKLLWDPLRPKYHFLPPEGSWNDVNGAWFHKGRYHLGYLRKIENDNALPGWRHMFSSWGHISSRDLLHWTHHPASLMDPGDGAYSRGYIASGAVMEDTEGNPVVLANLRGQGATVFRSTDGMLTWQRVGQGPIVAENDARYPEIFTGSIDTDCWREGDIYYALIGQKVLKPGYEGDSTGLFRSHNLIDWEYLHPFYRSRREWTGELEDCACPNFFQFGDKYMLVMHTHMPYIKCQYYIGRYEDLVFKPEMNGQLSQPGSLMGGPRLLLDDKGRRLFWGWLREARPAAATGWSGVMTLPWHFTPDADGSLCIAPAQELRTLRYGHLSLPDQRADDRELILPLASCQMELKLRIETSGAAFFGIKLLCSEDGDEETVLAYDDARRAFVIDFARASLDPGVRYDVLGNRFQGSFPWAGRYAPPENTCVTDQVTPYPLHGGGVDLDIFVDCSVIEVFVDGKIALVQRVYPTSGHGGVRLFARGGSANFSNIEKWEMDATNPW